MASKLAESEMIGRHFGRLTVMSLNCIRTRIMSRPIRVWDCSCSCGGSITLDESRLIWKDSRVTSCGCEFWEPLPIPESLVCYVAGLIDGEGCFGLIPTARRYDARLTIGMTGDGLQWVWNRIQVGRLNHKKAQRNNWKPSMVWTVSGNDLRRLLPMVYPHLLFKAGQANLVLEYLKIAQHATKADDERRRLFRKRSHEIYRAVRSLNKKGV